MPRWSTMAAIPLCLYATYFSGHLASAAPPFSDEQHKAFSDVFGLATPQAQKEVATKRELEILLDAQNKRVALPSTLEAYKAYLQRNELQTALKQKKVPALGTILAWNLNALDLTAIDHTILTSNDPNSQEQYGPHRTSRVLAIVHLAIFEAVNTAYKNFESYHNLQPQIVASLQATFPGITPGQITNTTAFVDTAITEAAHDTLVALYPKKKDFVDLDESVSLQGFGNGTDPSQMDTQHRLGYYLGKAAAKAVLDDRGYDAAQTAKSGVSTFNDGSTEPEPTANTPPFSTDGPDRWHPDPVHPLGMTALGGNWMHVRPFVIMRADAMRPSSEPAKTSGTFINAFKEVKRLGGDATPNQQAPRGTTPTTRTAAQTVIGDFWAYDGTALLCAPPRLYNEIATSIALHEKPVQTVANMARFLALVNLSLADAGISAWDAKYAFRLGRPVTYIRSQTIDGSPQGSSVANWTPLGAPVSNGSIDKRNLTPPFPSYPSGHAVFGGALFQTLRAYWSTNDSNEAFSFMSDEYNGRNYGPGETKPRPAITKKYKTFKEAEKENARSRIYLGIHWQFDADVGMSQGEEVATYVFNNALRPNSTIATD